MVITTDHFGNLITNIAGEELNPFAIRLVHAGGHEIIFNRTYGDVEPRALLALVNSFGVLEIARAEHNEAECLGIGRGVPIKVAERA